MACVFRRAIDGLRVAFHQRYFGGFGWFVGAYRIHVDLGLAVVIVVKSIVRCCLYVGVFTTTNITVTAFGGCESTAVVEQL